MIMDERDIERLTGIIESVVRKELLAIMAPTCPPALDPAEVALEDRRLLEAERTLPSDEFIVYRAELFAKRARALGNDAAADGMLKRAYAKADKLRRAAQ